MNPRRLPRAALLLPLLAPALAHADPPSLLDRALVATAVRHAVQRAGLGAEVTRDLAVRARGTGWLPQLSVRVVQRPTLVDPQTTDYPSTTPTSSTDERMLLDVRLSFALDRLVFDPSEVAIARLELERTERRNALEREVIDLLAVMERGRLELEGLSPEAPEAARTRAEVARARARLEALTGRSFGELRRAR
jgi:hypothetical protein